MIVITKFHTSNSVSNPILYPSEMAGMVYAYGTWAGANARIEVSADNSTWIPTSYTFNQNGIANIAPGMEYVRANINLALATTNVTVVVNPYRG